jgi:hypothetical protein
MEDVRRQRQQRKFNQPHPNSLVARTIGDPELKRKYEEWRKRSREDAQAMERWARNDYSSFGSEELYGTDPKEA